MKMYRLLACGASLLLLIGCETFSPEPETELYPDEETRLLVDEIEADKEVGLRRVLPHLEADWTPVWWHEIPNFPPQIRPGVTFADIVGLLAKGNVIYFDTDVRTDMEGEKAGTSQAPAIHALPNELGTRGEFIEHLCLVYDYWCGHNEQGLFVRKFRIKSYVLDVQPGTFNISGAGGGSGGAGGSGAQTSGFESLRTTLGTVVGAYPGEQMEIVEPTNLLILKARPSTHVHAQRFIDEFNRRMREVIEIQVAVFELDTRRGRGFSLTASSDDFGDLSNLQEPSGDDAGGGDDSKPAPGNDNGLQGFRAIIANAIADQTINAVFRTGNAAKSFGVALRILNKVSSARVAFNATIETRNNVPTELSNTRDFTYVKSIQEVAQRYQQGDSRTSFQVSFEEIQTGWTVGVQPTLGEDGIVNVRLGVARSDLVDVTTVDLGDDGSVNNFTTDNMSRLFNLTLREGESRLITSVMDSTTRNTKSPLSSLNDNAITQFAILVTARVTTP